jgi:hypothetical protein
MPLQNVRDLVGEREIGFGVAGSILNQALINVKKRIAGLPLV